MTVKKETDTDTYWTLPTSDYTVKFDGADSQTEAGTYMVTVSKKSDNVTGEATAQEPMVIGKYDLSGDKVTATIDDQYFIGSQLRPALSSLQMSGTDISADDYDVLSYGKNVNAGTGTVTLRAKETSTKFKGDREVTFKILPADLSTRTASVAYADVVLANDATDTHQLTLNEAKTQVTTSFVTGQAVTLAPASLKVCLKKNDDTTNGTALSPYDYDVCFQKDAEEPVAAIPAGDIGEWKVVVKGRTNTNADPQVTNTTGQYVTTGLTVKVTLTVTLPESEWVTYYDERFSLNTPTGYNAYYVTGIAAATEGNNGTVNTSSAMTYIPKGVPMLLERTSEAPEGVYTFELEEDLTGTIPTDNSDYFVGVKSTGEQTGGDPAYILMNSLFVGYEQGVVIAPNRAYLTALSSHARQLTINIGSDTTGIVDAARLDDDGEMMNEKWYDLQGNRISKPTRKGLYIRNGQKVAVK